MAHPGVGLRLRPFKDGDAPFLWEVLRSSVHGLTQSQYSAAQRKAWAPVQAPADWSSRLMSVRPRVIEQAGVPVAFGDLQPPGHITYFYVADDVADRGIGTWLMRTLLDQARRHKVSVLSSDVSRTAQPFFERFGWRVFRLQEPCRGGIVLPNARMIRDRAALPDDDGAAAWATHHD